MKEQNIFRQMRDEDENPSIGNALVIIAFRALFGLALITAVVVLVKHI